MGAYRFERIPGVKGSHNNVMEFDSSADRAIAKKYGYQLGSIELKEREAEATDNLRVFDVYARENSAEGQPLRELKYRGELMCMTRDAIWNRQVVGQVFEEAFPPTKESAEEFHVSRELRN